MRHDYLGRRVSKTIYGSPNVTIRYAYDGDRIIAEYNGSGTLLRKFVYGPGIDEPIYLIDVADNNAVYYYHFDGLGSVVALSDVNNVLMERYAYDVFGRPMIRDVNGTEIAESAFANPYLFTGRAYDVESGLYYYRARYYDYYTGRFLQPDPTGYTDGLNLYSYCGSNPVNFRDPLGLLREDYTTIADAVDREMKNDAAFKASAQLLGFKDLLEYAMFVMQQLTGELFFPQHPTEGTREEVDTQKALDKAEDEYLNSVNLSGNNPGTPYIYVHRHTLTEGTQVGQGTAHPEQFSGPDLNATRGLPGGVIDIYVVSVPSGNVYYYPAEINFSPTWNPTYQGVNVGNMSAPGFGRR